MLVGISGMSGMSGISGMSGTMGAVGIVGILGKKEGIVDMSIFRIFGIIIFGIIGTIHTTLITQTKHKYI